MQADLLYLRHQDQSFQNILSFLLLNHWCSLTGNLLLRFQIILAEVSLSLIPLTLLSWCYSQKQTDLVVVRAGARMVFEATKTSWWQWCDDCLKNLLSSSDGNEKSVERGSRETRTNEKSERKEEETNECRIEQKDHITKGMREKGLRDTMMMMMMSVGGGCFFTVLRPQTFFYVTWLSFHGESNQRNY